MPTAGRSTLTVRGLARLRSTRSPPTDWRTCRAYPTADRVKPICRVRWHRGCDPPAADRRRTRGAHAHRLLVRQRRLARWTSHGRRRLVRRRARSTQPRPRPRAVPTSFSCSTSQSPTSSSAPARRLSARPSTRCCSGAPGKPPARTRRSTWTANYAPLGCGGDLNERELRLRRSRWTTRLGNQM
jgi:hypothetical protein